MSERSGCAWSCSRCSCSRCWSPCSGGCGTCRSSPATSYRGAAAENRIREVVTPAVARPDPRRPRPAAGRATAPSLVVSVDRTALLEQHDDGEARAGRGSPTVLGDAVPAGLATSTRLCGTPGAPKPPICWNGSPYQPIPVAEDVDTADRAADHGAARGLPRRDRRARRRCATTRSRYGANAAHVLGYLGPVTDDELAERSAAAAGRRQRQSYSAPTWSGAAGLEQQYDDVPARPPGRQDSSRSTRRGDVTGTVAETPADAGRLPRHQHRRAGAGGRREAAARRRSSGPASIGDINKDFEKLQGRLRRGRRHGRQHRAASSRWRATRPTTRTSGSAASAPRTTTRSPARRRTTRNQSRAFQGEFAPGSTFKVDLDAGRGQGRLLAVRHLPCPSYLHDRRPTKSQLRVRGATAPSRSQRAIEVSCDTVFYKFAYDDVAAARAALDARRERRKDPFVKMAKALRLRQADRHRPAGRGRRADRRPRTGKQRLLEGHQGLLLRYGKTGYPRSQDRPSERLPAAARRRRTASTATPTAAVTRSTSPSARATPLVTPLQMARVYAAIANGGTLYQPQDRQGDRRRPTARSSSRSSRRQPGTLPVLEDDHAYLQRRARAASPSDGTGSGPFAELPARPDPGRGQDRHRRGRTARQTTSWFASYAPANKPQYAVVMMVSQGGTGSGIVGPSVAEHLQGAVRRHGQRRSTRQGRSCRADTRRRRCPTIGRRRHRRHAQATTAYRPAKP